MSTSIVNNVCLPLSSALSYRPAFDTMGKLANYGKLGGAAAPDPNAAVIALFSNSEEGFIYDFFDKEKIFQNTDGTGAVTTDGDPIGYAEDLSGNANHATAPSTGNRPLYYGYADFDGTDDRLLTPSITFGANSSMTLIIGVRKDASGTGMVIESEQNSSVSGFWVCSDDGGSDNYEICIRNPANPVVLLNGITSPSRNLLTVKFDLGASGTINEIVTRLDKALVTPTVAVNTDSFPFGFLNNPISLGGRPGSSSVAFNGRIYRALLIDRLLTNEEITIAEDWVEQSFI